MFREEKECKNPECDEIIQYSENPKKLFCDLPCKSRYHYLKDTDENAEIILLNKAIRTNYKIIVNFIANDVYKVDAEVARAMGFNRRVYMDLLRRFPGEKNYRSLRRIKDVYFVYNMEYDCIYLYDNNRVKNVA